MTKTSKSGVDGRVASLRFVTALICLLTLLVVVLAAAFAVMPGHPGSGLAWACLAAIFVFISIVVIARVPRGEEISYFPASDWIPSASPRAPPFPA